jgi:hypothetical protein
MGLVTPGQCASPRAEAPVIPLSSTRHFHHPLQCMLAAAARFTSSLPPPIIPLFQLPSIAKALSPVEAPSVFANRISKERELLTSHSEAGRLFVSFVHNGDQQERFHHPNSHPYQITLGIALLFTLQGIPSLYYGIRIRSYRDDRCRRQNRVSPRMCQPVKR